MSTLVIVGAGDIGGTVARHAARAGVVRRILLVDDAAEPAAGKALDLAQAAPVDGYTAQVAAASDPAVVAGAACIVVADGFGPPSREWQGEDGLALVRRLAELEPVAPIICAGAEQIDLVERGVLELGVERRRLFGSAPEAVRAAIVSLAALEAECAPAEVSLAVLGRPPARLVVPWDEAAIGGRAAPHVLSAAALARLDDRIARLWPPGPRTLGAAAARLVHVCLTRSPRQPAAFVVPDRLGDAGRPDAVPALAQRGAALPVILGPRGVARIIVPPLSTRDRVRFETALHA